MLHCTTICQLQDVPFLSIHIKISSSNQEFLSNNKSICGTNRYQKNNSRWMIDQISGAWLLHASFIDTFLNISHSSLGKRKYILMCFTVACRGKCFKMHLNLCVESLCIYLCMILRKSLFLGGCGWVRLYTISRLLHYSCEIFIHSIRPTSCNWPPNMKSFICRL